MNELSIGDEVTFPGGHGKVIRTDELQDGNRLLYIFEPPETIHKYPSSLEIVRTK